VIEENINEPQMNADKTQIDEESSALSAFICVYLRFMSSSFAALASDEITKHNFSRRLRGWPYV
jgi:hypothetical protein